MHYESDGEGAGEKRGSKFNKGPGVTTSMIKGTRKSKMSSIASDGYKALYHDRTNSSKIFQFASAYNYVSRGEASPDRQHSTASWMNSGFHGILKDNQDLLAGFAASGGTDIFTAFPS